MLLAIIDDNATNLQVYVNIVSQIDGVTTRTFESSAAALDFFKRVEPDLIITDYRMPAPNGIELIKAYRELRPAAQTPMLMITAAQDAEVRRQALEAGTNDFLTKPADPVEFLARVRNLLSGVQARRSFESKVSQRVAGYAHEAAVQELDVVYQLMRAVGYREDRDGKRVIRIGRMATILGRELLLPPDEQRLLSLAAPMHDVGMVAVSDAVLQKHGPLTQPEMQMVRRHPAVGQDILSAGVAPVLRMAAEVSLGHHERWDGTGYPAGASGESIPISARIVAVADAFEAMTRDRNYRRAIAPDAALAELRRLSGTYYDPAVVEAALAEANAMVEVVKPAPAGGAGA